MVALLTVIVGLAFTSIVDTAIFAEMQPAVLVPVIEYEFKPNGGVTVNVPPVTV